MLLIPIFANLHPKAHEEKSPRKPPRDELEYEKRDSNQVIF